MFGKSFAHYLSYGASDQHTARELRGTYDGLLVPGTIAAFQRQGTGGFVLSLSASDTQTPYVIDPRSPLFQQPLKKPKRAHQLLRELLGIPEAYQPDPTAFTPDFIAEVARHWVKFNTEYKSTTSAKFEKYARRLGDIKEDTAAGPEAILAPYFVSDGPEDPWWKVSDALFIATCIAAKAHPQVPCFRVVAARSVEALSKLIPLVPSGEKVVVWVSGLDELHAKGARLAAYGKTIAASAKLQQDVFGLYGGFFSVLLSSQGLQGASHGIGYGEHRDWVELPKSGSPPPRYYVPEIHKYIRTELADVLWGAQITECACAACDGDPPILLDYHELMMHSVYCRKREIDEWSVLTPSQAEARLARETVAFSKKLEAANIDEEPFKVETRDHMAHIPEWVTALKELG